MSTTSDFKYKRSDEMENAAAEQIVSLFVDAWNETSQKSSREVMAIVLLTMKDACQVIPSTDDTEEHIMLLHANTYFEELIQRLNSSEPLPIAIAGNTYDDMLNNLRKIKQVANEEEFGTDVIKRIDSFISKIRVIVGNVEKANSMARSKALSRGIIFAIIGFVVYLVGMLLAGMEINISGIFIGLLVSAVFLGVAIGDSE